MKTAATPNLSTLVVACAVKRAPKKSGMNAGKFIGGQNLGDRVVMSVVVVVDVVVVVVVVEEVHAVAFELLKKIL